MPAAKTKITAIVNQKGGVGKTTLTFNLAHGLARTGRKVLLIDNDPQANLTSSCLQRGQRLEAFAADLYAGRVSKAQPVANRLWILGATDGLEEYVDAETGAPEFARVVKAISSKGLFDHILIDCAPTTTNLFLAALMASTHFLVPLTPSKYSLDGLKKLFSKIKELRTTGASRAQPLGFVVNMATGTTYHRQTLLALGKTHHDLLFESVLRKLTAFEESPALAKSVFDHAALSEAALEMTNLVREFEIRINGGK